MTSHNRLFTSTGKDKTRCKASLMSPQYIEEGYTCTLESGHPGPHRDERMSINEDIHGNKYVEICEWAWIKSPRFKSLYHDKQGMIEHTW
jgi:hypothetical protein